MSLITDPTLLLAGNSDAATTPGAELVINTTAKTIQLVPGAGDLTLASSGATGQALYSALKVLWKNSSTYIKFPFPMEAITPEQFEFINGWRLVACRRDDSQGFAHLWLGRAKRFWGDHRAVCWCDLSGFSGCG